MEKTLTPKQFRLICMVFKLAMVLGIVLSAIIACVIFNYDGQKTTGELAWVYLLIPFVIEFVLMLIYPLIKKGLLKEAAGKNYNPAIPREFIICSMLESCGMIGIAMLVGMRITYNPSALPWYIMYFNFIHPIVTTLVMLARPLPTIQAHGPQVENPYA